jgi:arginyl-tRNA synthetase
MEFFVVDPKDFTFVEWSNRIRTFLRDEKLKFSEEDGELYYQGDDIAAAWDENSILFKVKGEASGLIEVRDADRHFYVFTDDLDLFEDKK